MVDIATIGYAVDTSGLKRGEAALDSFRESSQQVAVSQGAVEAAAKRAGISVEEMRARIDRASAAVSGFKEELNQVPPAATRMATGVGTASRQMAQQAQVAATGMGSRITGAFDSALAVAQSVTASIGTAVTGAFNSASASVQNFKQLLASVPPGGVGGGIFSGPTNTLGALPGIFNAVPPAASRATASIALARHELVNLSRQFQDVGVSLYSGQSPFTVLAQQGAQIADVFASSQGNLRGFFNQTFGWLRGLFTLGRTVFLGVAAAIGTAVAALASYSSAQADVRRSLMGIGAASGITQGGVNQVASQTASPLGLSISEAREFASTLAATGRVGREEIGSLTKLGFRFATVLGVDATEAAKMLAKAMSDPVRGAEQINERLGFMDAAQQRLIKNLVEQNRIAEAQRIIIAGIEKATKDAAGAVGFWTNVWNGATNVLSNVWDWIGRIAARTLNIGQPLEDQIAQVARKIQTLEGMQRDKVPNFIQLGLGGGETQLAAARAELARLLQMQKDQTKASEEARQRLESFRVAAAAMDLLPEIAQLDRLKNAQELLVETMLKVQLTGNEESEVLKRLGITFEQLVAALAKASSQVRNFQTEFEQAVKAQQLQLQAITAFSPTAKADIAAQQRYNAEIAKGTEEIKARTLAEGERQIVLKQESVAIAEAARERRLQAKQTNEALELEIRLIGASIGEQTRLRADLQLRHQMEQDAARRRVAFDEEEFKRLQKANAERGKLAQQQAIKGLWDQAEFDKATLFFSDTEKQVANILRSVEAANWKNMMASPLADAIRFNLVMKDIGDTLGNLATSFVQGIQQGKSIAESLYGSLISIGNQIASNLAKQGMQNAIAGAISGNPMQAGQGLAQIGIAIAISALTADAERRRKEAEEFRQAQEAWAKMAGEVAKFTDKMHGRNQGALTQALAGATEEAQRFADAAHKAGKGAEEINAALVAFTQRAVRDFISSFDLMIEAFEMGLGSNSPAIKGAENIRSIGKTLKGFLDDTVEVAKRTMVMGGGGVLDSQGRGGGGTFLPGAVAAINAAREATLQYAISLLGEEEQLSRVQSRLLELRGESVALHQVLMDLGASSEQAAAMIHGKLNAEIAKLGAEFVERLQRGINEATGKGHFNTLADLLKQSAGDFRDARLLGADPALVARYFAVQAQKIVDEAGLVGESFDELLRIFPELTGVVTESTEALKEQAEFMKNLRRTIEEFLTGIKLGPISPLSPAAQLEEARRAYEETFGRAQGGDREAAGRITQVAQAFLEQARGFLGPSVAFGEIFDQVQNQLRSLTVEPIVDPIVGALQETNATLQAIKVLQDATSGISESIELSTRMLGQQAANLGDAQGSQFFGPMVDYLRQIETNTRTTGTPADPPGPRRVWWNPFTWFREGGIVGAYEPGGLVGNGIWNQDSVRARFAGGGDIMLAGGEFVMPAPSVNGSTLPMLEAMRRTGGAPNTSMEIIHEQRAARQEARAHATALVAAIREGNDMAARILSEIEGLRTDTDVAKTASKVREQSTVAA